jgi:hypothetical protein
MPGTRGQLQQRDRGRLVGLARGRPRVPEALRVPVPRVGVAGLGLLLEVQHRGLGLLPRLLLLRLPLDALAVRLARLDHAELQLRLYVALVRRAVIPLERDLVRARHL